MSLSLGLLTLHFHIPGCSSLKEKRGRLKPLIARLQREFNVSAAEIDHQDTWQNATIACVMVSNNKGFTQKSLHEVVNWIENSWFDLDLIDEVVELI